MLAHTLMIGKPPEWRGSSKRADHDHAYPAMALLSLLEVEDDPCGDVAALQAGEDVVDLGEGLDFDVGLD
jgi:hypothetical protein